MGTEDSSADNVKDGHGGNRVSWRGKSKRDFIGNGNCNVKDDHVMEDGDDDEHDDDEGYFDDKDNSDHGKQRFGWW